MRLISKTAHLLSKIIFKSDDIFKSTCKDAVCIFTYHDVSQCPSPFSRFYNLTVSPELFEKQIQMIFRLFNVITPEELISGNYKTPAALITFDDGMPGYFVNAVPILVRYKCPSVIFLNMAPLDNEIFWSGLLAYLCNCDDDFIKWIKNKNDVKEPYILNCPNSYVENYLEMNNRELIYQAARNYYGNFATREDLSVVAGNKLVYFGNHLYNHYNCATLTSDELHDAYSKNQIELAKYPNNIEIFSYPFGQYGCFNELTHNLISSFGAKKLFSAINAVNTNKSSRFMHRISIYSHIENMDALKYLVIYSRLPRVINHLKTKIMK